MPKAIFYVLKGGYKGFLGPWEGPSATILVAILRLFFRDATGACYLRTCNSKTMLARCKPLIGMDMEPLSILHSQPQPL